MGRPTKFYFTWYGYWLAKIFGPDWLHLWELPKVRVKEILSYLPEEDLRDVLEWQGSDESKKAVAFVYTEEDLPCGDPRWKQVVTRIGKIPTGRKIRARFFSQAMKRFTGWSLGDIIFDSETECDIAENDHGSWHLVIR